MNDVMIGIAAMPLAVFVIAFVASVLSGIAGGGAGFVTAPMWLVLGMNPAQGGATGAVMATGMSISSISAFRKSGHLPHDKKLLYFLLAVTLLASVAGAIIVPKVDANLFKDAMAVVTIAALPLLFTKLPSKNHTDKHSALGLILAGVLLAVGSIITSSAFSILFSVVLIIFFGFSMLQTTALKRIIFFVQGIVLLIGFMVQGFLVWQYALAAFLGGTLGAYIGTKYAVKKGDKFAKYALAAVSLLGAVVLLIQ